MAATFEEEKRERLINAVGNYFLYAESPSYRRCIEYIKLGKDSISLPTVKDYLKKYIANNPSKGEIILARINLNKPKTVEDEKVENRVLIAANMIANGLNVDEVVRLTGESKNVIYKDITERIFALDNDLGNRIKVILEANSRANLMQGNDAYLNQERNSDGTFKK